MHFKKLPKRQDRTSRETSIVAAVRREPRSAMLSRVAIATLMALVVSTPAASRRALVVWAVTFANESRYAPAPASHMRCSSAENGSTAWSGMVASWRHCVWTRAAPRRRVLRAVRSMNGLVARRDSESAGVAGKIRILQQNSLAQHWARDWRALALTQVHRGPFSWDCRTAASGVAWSG